jgi:8-amino-3,8-dideoxy-alpha-D-manno-octulosonate transaminase
MTPGGVSLKRRNFIATASAASAASASESSPVRATPLRAGFWGTHYYDSQERAELLDVLDRRSPFRWYGPGKPGKVLQFEKEFAARMRRKFALGVTSGTAALQVAVAALGIGPGDEVILPAWTWHSCYNAIVLAGGLPVFAEIDDSFNIDPAAIERQITSHTKAIMAVHLLGNPCDMERILAIAAKFRLPVIEDCAQSVGASYKGRPVGSWGDVGIYSLQINKTITTGEGGVVVTDDPVLFERASRFHDLGGLRAPHQEIAGGSTLDWFPGANYRMSEFTGGVALAQLRKLDTIVAAVRSNALRVYEGIRGIEGAKLRLLPDPAGELGAGVFLDLRTKERCDRFVAAMKVENVIAAKPGGSVVLPALPHVIAKKTIHPGWPSFQTPRGRAIRYGEDTCPRTIDILQRYGGVLIDPSYGRKETDDIVAAIRKVYPASL